MIKAIKRISLVCCGLLIYSFIGGLTYSVHDHLYVGSDVRVEWGTIKNPNLETYNGSKIIGATWPIAIPIWAGVQVFHFVVEYVFFPIINVGISAGQEIVSE